MSQVVLFAEMILSSHSGANPSLRTKVHYEGESRHDGCYPSKNQEDAVNQVRLVSERSA